ncbi:MAG: dihydroorotate dehydrogenase electron transfer subunit [Firmicutes bacterium]|nr:dihydroorotate dehydrogenase electron transfer subunit [Bacillota bacterium]
MRLQQTTVLANEPLTPDIFRLTVSLPEELPEPVQPGQFCNLRISGNSHDPLLRRPISISDWDRRLNNLKFVIKKVGRGTKALSRLYPGQKLDLFGPLGRGFPTDHLREGQHALLVGGGVGIPPLLLLAKKLAAKKVKVTAFLGFRSKNDAFLYEEFARYGKIKLTSDDGSLGRCGNVCSLLADCLNQGLAGDSIYACGPLPMLKSLEELAARFPWPAYVSLEQRMACGIGACAACTCRRKDPEPGEDWYRLVCTDGPVFRLGEVELSE